METSDSICSDPYLEQIRDRSSVQRGCKNISSQVLLLGDFQAARPGKEIKAWSQEAGLL